MKEYKIWAVKDGYLVNRDGSIYKLNYKKTKTMRKVKQSLSDSGYLYFNFKGKLVKSHRFIAECFLINPNNLPCINHKDEDKTNNCVDNLEWCNYKYNINYGTRNIRCAKTNSKTQTNDPKKSKKVYQYTKDGDFIKDWVSLREIERKLGYSIQGISSCCLGNRKSYKGFIWKYKTTD